MILSGMFGTGSRNPDALLQAACDASVDSFWLAPRYRDTVYQDSAGTTPWAADGDPVGRVVDQGGRGYAFVQATSASRPLGVLDGDVLILRGDGVDDQMAAGDVCDLRTSSMFAVCVIQIHADITGGGGPFVLAKASTIEANSSYLYRRVGQVPRMDSIMVYSDGTLQATTTHGQDADFSVQIVAFHVDRAGGMLYQRKNGALVDAAVIDDFPESFDQHVAAHLKILANSTGNSLFEGAMREAIICIRPGAQIALGEIEAIEGRLAAVHGVTL